MWACHLLLYLMSGCLDAIRSLMSGKPIHRRHRGEGIVRIAEEAVVAMSAHGNVVPDGVACRGNSRPSRTFLIGVKGNEMRRLQRSGEQCMEE